jgi:hypothetical protein
MRDPGQGPGLECRYHGVGIQADGRYGGSDIHVHGPRQQLSTATGEARGATPAEGGGSFRRYIGSHGTSTTSRIRAAGTDSVQRISSLLRSAAMDNASFWMKFHPVPNRAQASSRRATQSVATRPARLGSGRVDRASRPRLSILSLIFYSRWSLSFSSHPTCLTHTSCHYNTPTSTFLRPSPHPSAVPTPAADASGTRARISAGSRGHLA